MAEARAAIGGKGSGELPTATHGVTEELLWQRPLHFSQQGMLALHFGEGRGISAPRAEGGEEQAIGELRGGFSRKAEMEGTKAVGGEDECAVVIIEGRGKKHMAMPKCCQPG